MKIMYIELAKTRVGVAMLYSSKCIFEGIVTNCAMCQNLLISMSGVLSYPKSQHGRVRTTMKKRYTQNYFKIHF